MNQYFFPPFSYSNYSIHFPSLLSSTLLYCIALRCAVLHLTHIDKLSIPSSAFTPTHSSFFPILCLFHILITEKLSPFYLSHIACFSCFLLLSYSSALYSTQHNSLFYTVLYRTLPCFYSVLGRVVPG